MAGAHTAAPAADIRQAGSARSAGRAAGARPRRPRRAALSACLIVAASLAAALARPPGVAASAAPEQVPAFAAARCGSIAIDYQRTPDEHYSRMHIAVRGKRVACSRARRIMRRYARDRRPCPPDGGNTCTRRYRDRWLCSAPTAGAYPLVQVCERGRTTITGKVRRRSGAARVGGRTTPPVPR